MEADNQQKLPKYCETSSPARGESFADWCIRREEGELERSSTGICFTRAGWEAIRPHLTLGAILSIKMEWAMLNATGQFTVAKRLKVCTLLNSGSKRETDTIHRPLPKGTETS